MAKATFIAERSRQFDFLQVKEATFLNVDGCSERASELSMPGQDKTRQDNLITFLHVTVMTDLAPQVAEASRGGPGTIKINEFC